MIKALIFDFDGLIMDTESPEVETWKDIYAQHGQEFPLDIWVREVVGSTDSNFDPIAHLSSLTGKTLDVDGLRQLTSRLRLEKQAVAPALPGVKEILQSARTSGLRLAIASSSTHDWVDGYLRRLGFYDYFEVIKCCNDVKQVKPAPDLFQAALDALNVQPDEALVFEDSPNGILAAHRAGLRVVVVPNPITAKGEIHGADLRLPSLDAIPLEHILLKFDLQVRPELPEDIPGIRTVEEAAFAQTAEADLVDLVRSRNKAVLSLVAVYSGRILGHILFTPVTLDPHRPGWHGVGLGPVAVLPEYQGAGIGSRLIELGLEMCRSHGYDFAVLLGDPRYYSRFGFIPGAEFGLGNEYGVNEEFMARELHPGVLRGAKGVIKYVPEFSEAGA